MSQHSWLSVDLGVFVKPSHYTIRHARGYSASALRNWDFQVSSLHFPFAHGLVVPLHALNEKAVLEQAKNTLLHRMVLGIRGWQDLDHHQGASRRHCPQRARGYTHLGGAGSSRQVLSTREGLYDGAQQLG